MHTDLAAQYRAYYTTYISDIEPLTALCGARAIDSVMGKEWFEKFRKQELTFDTKIATVMDSHESIFECDFQGIIKMFRFREEENDVKFAQKLITITPVFQAFHLPRKERGRSVFSASCDTLIANRNHVHHLGLAAAKTKDTLKLRGNISILKKAILDCVAFLEYFKDVVDENGQPYIDQVYRVMEELESTYKNVRYNTLAVIKTEEIAVTPERFAEICRELYISTFVIKGISYFESSDYEADLRAIKAIAKNDTTKKNNLPVILGAFAAVAVVAILLVTLLPKDGETSGNAGLQTNPPVTGTSDSTAPSDTTAPSTSAPPAVVKISGTGDYEGLAFTINQKLSNRFVIKVKNNDDCDYSFGWVFPSEVVIETTTSTYFGKVEGGTLKVTAGGTVQLVVNIEEEMEGDIESVTVQNILPLSSRGLPEGSNTTGAVVDIPITYTK